MSRKKRQRNRMDRNGRQINPPNAPKENIPCENETSFTDKPSDKVRIITRNRIVFLLGVSLAFALSQLYPRSDKTNDKIKTEQSEQQQSCKLSLDPKNIPHDEYDIINSLINEFKIQERIENILGNYRDKRPFRLVWTDNGESIEHGKRMHSSADAQVFKDKQLVLLNGGVFRMYRNYMSEEEYRTYFIKRLIHELIHAYIPCHFENDHFEEGLADYISKRFGEEIGLEETVQEMSNPLDFRYSNKQIFAKNCPFVSQFEWLSRVYYFNGRMMWEKIVAEDQNILKRLLEEITKRGLKDSRISKKMTIDLLLSINPKLKGLIDSFEFLSDFRLTKPQIAAFPLNFDKTGNGLLITLLRRDENDGDMLAKIDYFDFRIVVNGQELSNPRLFISPKQSELLIQERLVGTIQIFASGKGNSNMHFETELEIEDY